MNPTFYLIPLVIFAGYYFYQYKLGGNEKFQKMYRKKFGLRDGEVPHAVYTSYYALRNNAGIVVQVLGGGERGAHVLIALTNTNRLLIGHNEVGGAPLQFEYGQLGVTASERQGDHSKLANSMGKMEPAAVVHLYADGIDLHLSMATSAAEAIHRWALGEGVPALPVALG